jgi:hypothetical protein
MESEGGATVTPEKWFELEADDDDKDLTKHKIHELEAGKRTTWDVACPLCKVGITRTRYYEGLVVPDRVTDDDPARAKALFLSCQNGHNFVVFVSGDEGWHEGMATLYFGEQTKQQIAQMRAATVSKQAMN